MGDAAIAQVVLQNGWTDMLVGKGEGDQQQPTASLCDVQSENNQHMDQNCIEDNAEHQDDNLVLKKRDTDELTCADEKINL